MEEHSLWRLQKEEKQAYLYSLNSKSWALIQVESPNQKETSEGLGYSELKGLYGPLCGEMCQSEYLLLLLLQPVWWLSGAACRHQSAINTKCSDCSFCCTETSWTWSRGEEGCNNETAVVSNTDQHLTSVRCPTHTHTHTRQQFQFLIKCRENSRDGTNKWSPCVESLNSRRWSALVEKKKKKKKKALLQRPKDIFQNKGI